MEKLRKGTDGGKTARKKRTPLGAVLTVMILITVALFLVSAVIGQYYIPVKQVIQVIFGHLFGLEQTWDDSLNTVLFNVRLPRIFCALMVGAALSCSGAAYQGVFKNPMVSPDILGAAAGAGFGATLAILMDFSPFWVEILAFVMGMVAVGITMAISSVINRGSNTVLILVLTGIVVQALFSAFVSIIKYVADPESKLPEITYWLMGGLNKAGKSDVLMMLIPLLVGLIPMFLYRWRINVLSFGEEEAKALGVNTGRTRLVFVVCATLLTSASVSICGMVGWVGLVIPHLARLIVGPDYRRLMPMAMLLGACFLLGVDDVSRTVFSTEIPLSILTAIIGAPFFLYLLVKGKEGWNAT